MAKRILIFSFVYYPRFIGGAEIAIKEITDRISESEIEFDLIALRLNKGLPKREKIGNVNVHRIGLIGMLALNKYLYPFLACMKAARLHSQRKYDAIWSMMANYSGFGALFFKLSHRNAPFLLSLQEGDSMEHIKKRVGIFAPMFKMIFARADFIQAISNYLAEFGREMGATCPIEVVPNGVDVSLFTKEYPKEEILGVRKELEIPSSAPLLITTSRLVPKNAVGDVIRALEYIPDAYFLILGAGYEETILKRLADEIGVSERVRFLGFIHHDDMPKYLKASDIFVRPSLSEGFGNSFIEAMAARVPVIATEVGGIVDFLKDKQTGLFCEVNSPEDIARKADIYIRDKNLRDEIVDNAFNMAAKKYDWSLVASRMRSDVFAILIP